LNRYASRSTGHYSPSQRTAELIDLLYLCQLIIQLVGTNCPVGALTNWGRWVLLELQRRSPDEQSPRTRRNDIEPEPQILTRLQKGKKRKLEAADEDNTPTDEWRLRVSNVISRSGQATQDQPWLHPLGLLLCMTFAIGPKTRQPPRRVREETIPTRRLRDLVGAVLPMLGRVILKMVPARGVHPEMAVHQEKEVQKEMAVQQAAMRVVMRAVILRRRGLRWLGETISIVVSPVIAHDRPVHFVALPTLFNANRQDPFPHNQGDAVSLSCPQIVMYPEDTLSVDQQERRESPGTGWLQ